MRLRCCFGSNYKIWIVCILGLVAFQYMLLFHWVISKYPDAASETSLLNMIASVNFLPKQIGVREKRDVFETGGATNTETSDGNAQNPDFDTSYNDGGTDQTNSGTTLLLLFTTYGSNKEKQGVHETLLRLWSSWSQSAVHPLVFTKDSGVRDTALASNWLALPIGETVNSCKGPPVLRNLFKVSMQNYEAFFYGFANADIIFGNGLIATLQYLQEKYKSSETPVLVIGRRRNYDFVNNQPYLQNPSEVGGLLSDGTLVDRSTDYYITNKRFHWEGVPMVSVGRLYIARSVVAFAIKHKYDVIDATQTIESVHLTTADGNYASQSKPGRNCNHYILKKSKQKLPLHLGHCECAKLETVYNDEGHIELRSRKPPKNICRGLK